MTDAIDWSREIQTEAGGEAHYVGRDQYDRPCARIRTGGTWRAVVCTDAGHAWEDHHGAGSAALHRVVNRPAERATDGEEPATDGPDWSAISVSTTGRIEKIDWSVELQTEDGQPARVIAEGAFNNDAWPRLAAVGDGTLTSNNIYAVRHDGLAVRLNNVGLTPASENPTRIHIVNRPPKTVTREGFVVISSAPFFSEAGIIRNCRVYDDRRTAEQSAMSGDQIVPVYFEVAAPSEV